MNAMNNWKRINEEAAAPAAAPAQCPACRSTDVMTASKNVTAESYWRCVSCGEVWNVGRRVPTRGGLMYNR
jgi:transposase-like protein